MPLLKDPISTPERAHQGAFVLQFTQRVTAPQRTLHDAVATPEQEGLRGWAPVAQVARRGWGRSG